MRRPEGIGGLLLLPVSGGGSGELQRALVLADAVRARWPQHPLAICAEAGSLARLALPEGVRALPLPASPTHCTDLVRARIAILRPRVVLFDSTARARQMEAARDCGAGVVYLSSRPSARARGFGWRALARIDEHWSVEFDPQRRLPGPLQRVCLRWQPNCRWRALGSLHAPADPARLPVAVREYAGLGPYGLWCPGGGGGRVDGLAAPAAFVEAARRCGRRAIVVRPEAPADHAETRANLLICGALPNAALMTLLAVAEYAVLGAGSLLLQALAAGAPCAAVALASDQPQRLRVLLARDAVLAAGNGIGGLADAARRIADDPGLRARLRAQAGSLGLHNGLDEAITALARWLD
ncbi:MAG: hypothetical protein IT479_11655 [Xanthomonadales bacterium]|nr:hypothetical protein [Xanthomonadales bacterium]MCC6593917.1 hypothetical protein [Xanthomonadales bacterium]MCE7932055.1 hypothetical protein [Xanthomonadales bacterium PRO6]